MSPPRLRHAVLVASLAACGVGAPPDGPDPVDPVNPGPIDPVDPTDPGDDPEDPPDDPPPVTPPRPVGAALRRLSVRELIHVLGDLTGVDPTDAVSLPADSTPGGFDNQVAGADVSSLLVERLDVATSVAAEAWAAARLGAATRLEYEGTPELGCSLDDLSEEGDAWWGSYGHERLLAPVQIGQGGRYVLRAPAFLRNGNGVYTDVDVAFVVDGVRHGAFRFQRSPRSWEDPDPPVVLEQEVTLSAGAHTIGWELITPLVLEDVFPNAPCMVMGLLAVDHVDVVGPIASDSACAGSALDGCIEQDVLRLAARAWRRPILPEEEARLTAVVGAAREEGASWREVAAGGAHAVFLSPNLLFVEETVDAQGRLADHDLAEQLALFAWGSVGDDALSACADAGRLHDLADPCGVPAQLERMLADPRGTRFVEAFVGQWLRLDRPPPAPPEGTSAATASAIREAMLAETFTLFEQLLDDPRRPLLDFIDAPRSWVRPELAAWYGYFVGPSAGLVPIDGAVRGRGGLLGHGSVHLATARSGHTLPVHRGAWVRDVLLCDPPSDPPPDIPALSDGSADALIRHLQDPECASCHAAIDPFGAALDGFGPWSRPRASSLPPMPLPDGTELADLPTLRTWLRAHPRLAGCATATLATYALGRRFRVEDGWVKALGAEAAGRHGSLADLVDALVRSPLFTHREAATP